MLTKCRDYVAGYWPHANDPTKAPSGKQLEAMYSRLNPEEAGSKSSSGLSAAPIPNGVSAPSVATVKSR